MIRDFAWTVREVKLLREVQHMSQRAFAEHLGFAQSTVANWEKSSRTSVLHHETREVLNRELDRLPTETRDRFDRQLGAAPGKLGAGSAVRTTALLESLDVDVDSPLPYQSPTGAVEDFRRFLQSSARVFLLTGAAGSGKSLLTQHLARHLGTEVDIQLLTVGSWDLAGLDVAVEILRYASISRGHDALLTLETQCDQMPRPCVVVIDGIASHDEFTVIGRQVDAILRQVTTSMLRFVLTVRTPPTIETTAHPILHAAVFTPNQEPRKGNGTELVPWPPAKARSLWEQARAPHAPPFDRLPRAIQQLVQTPVYMRLALPASLVTQGQNLNAYALLDHCVQAILGGDASDNARAIATLTDLAHRQSREQLPAALVSADPATAEQVSQPRPLDGVADTIACERPHGRTDFTHDVIREFFLSTRIADLLHAEGRSIATVSAVNDLADRASTSGSAHSIIELVFQRLDNVKPDLLGYIATAPTASTSSTVPLIVSLADDAQFATPEVLRALAIQAEQDASINLSRALLRSEATHTALGHGRARWLLVLLRRFGTDIWPDVAGFIERTFDAADTYALLDTADLANGADATYFARHFYLFFADTSNGALESFLSHPNWRVRAALAEGIDDDRAPISDTAVVIIDRLVHDADYKVRAAVAQAITRAPRAVANSHLTTLLRDDNWHVRERTLRGLDQLGPDHPKRDLVTAALETIASDRSWRQCPSHIRPSTQRLQLLHDTEFRDKSSTAENDHRALLTVLREIRTEYLVLPPSLQRGLVGRALRSDSWLVRQEAESAATGTQCGRDGDDLRLSRERFRRARDHRAVQIALDMRDIDNAIAVARAAAEAGADFLEIGDPLIKEVGVRAIEEVKAIVPEATIVAEMMSADWGRDQVVLAAQAGADIVLLIGPATTASVSAAVEAGQRLGIPILLDTPPATTHRWVTDMERAGVDGFTVTTNIDIGIGSTTALEAAHTLRSWTQLPVAVSGGFSATDHAVFASPDWDILIVGRSVADAIDPSSAATRIVELAHHTERHR